MKLITLGKYKLEKPLECSSFIKNDESETQLYSTIIFPTDENLVEMLFSIQLSKDAHPRICLKDETCYYSGTVVGYSIDVDNNNDILEGAVIIKASLFKVHTK